MGKPPINICENNNQYLKGQNRDPVLWINVNFIYSFYVIPFLNFSIKLIWDVLKQVNFILSKSIKFS